MCGTVTLQYSPPPSGSLLIGGARIYALRLGCAAYPVLRQVRLSVREAIKACVLLSVRESEMSLRGHQCEGQVDRPKFIDCARESNPGFLSEKQVPCPFG